MHTHVYVDESVKEQPTSSGRWVCALSERAAEKLTHQSRQWLSGFSQEVDSCCSAHCQEPRRSAMYRGVQLAPNVCVCCSCTYRGAQLAPNVCVCVCVVPVRTEERSWHLVCLLFLYVHGEYEQQGRFRAMYVAIVQNAPE